MNPLVFIIPGILVMSGLVCFFLLPMPFSLRVTILALDVVGAVVLGLIMFRRFGGGN